jgi:hypothetical protein
MVNMRKKDFHRMPVGEFGLLEVSHSTQSQNEVRTKQ